MGCKMMQELSWQVVATFLHIAELHGSAPWHVECNDVVTQSSVYIEMKSL